jgi:hypothetical protein
VAILVAIFIFKIESSNFLRDSQYVEVGCHFKFKIEYS